MKKQPVFIFLLLITFLLMSLVLSGCGTVAEKASEKAAENALEQAAGGDAKVDLDSKGNVEVKTSEGTLKTGSNEWPKQIPADVPRFTDGKIISIVESTQNDQGQGVFVGIADAGMDAADKYKTELEKAGWSIIMSSKTPEAVMYSAQKDKGLVTVSFSINEGKLVSGGVTYSEQQ